MLVTESTRFKLVQFENPICIIKGYYRLPTDSSTRRDMRLWPTGEWISQEKTRLDKVYRYYQSLWFRTPQTEQLLMRIYFCFRGGNRGGGYNKGKSTKSDRSWCIFVHSYLLMVFVFVRKSWLLPKVLLILSTPGI